MERGDFASQELVESVNKIIVESDALAFQALLNILVEVRSGEKQ